MASLVGAATLVAACTTQTDGDEGAEETEETAAELQIGNGFAIRNGAYISNGLRLANGLRLLNGFIARNGASTVNGLRLANGLIAKNGVRAPNGFTLTITPGGEFDRWLKEDPVNNPMLLDYTAQCALGPSQAIDYTYGGVAHTVAGAMDFGPGWLDGGMTTVEKQRVSSCLLARVNAVGVRVTIDLTAAWRADMRNVDPNFPDPELAFWGNLFDTGEMYACQVNTQFYFDILQSRLCGQSEDSISRKDAYPSMTYRRPSPVLGVGRCGPALLSDDCSRICTMETVDGQSIPVACPGVASNRWSTTRSFTSPIVARYKTKPGGGSCTYGWECASAWCNFSCVAR